MNAASIGLGIMKASSDEKNDARASAVGGLVGRSAIEDARASCSIHVDEKVGSFVTLGRGPLRWAVGVLRPGPYVVQCNVHGPRTLASGGSSDVMEAASIGLGTMKVSSDVNNDASATG